MQIWYLSPFLLALLVWWVATRKHPEDKEKWTWLALGVCAGSVLMFTLAFFSQHKAAETADLADGMTPVVNGKAKARLENDSAVEVLAPVRIRQNRSVVAGSLQITLMKVTATTARLQLEPRQELELFDAPQWPYETGTDSANTSVTRTATEVTLGDYLVFGFRGRLYRLGLLEIQPPLWGFAPAEAQEVLASHAVIRLLAEGYYSTNSTISGEPNRGNTKAGVKSQGSVPPPGR
jgi:hypothetical protein